MMGFMGGSGVREEGGKKIKSRCFWVECDDGL